MNEINITQVNVFIKEYVGGNARLIEHFRQTAKVRLELFKGKKKAYLLFMGCRLFEGKSNWVISSFIVEKHKTGRYFLLSGDNDFFVEFDDLLIQEV